MRGRSVLVAAGLVILGVLGARFAMTRSPSESNPTKGPESVVGASTSTDEPRGTAAPPNGAPAPKSARTIANVPVGSAGTERSAPSGGDPSSRAPRTTEALIAALASTDDFVVLDAADELIERKTTRALPTLVAFDIKNRPHAAPTVIDALGQLASAADPVARRSATDRLLELLAQEKTRGAPESAGNLLGLYAALGHSLDPRAAPALEAELLDPKVTLAAKTVVVEALERLKQPSSAVALRTLQQQLSAVVPSDKMEEETQRDLSSAIERALRVIP